MRIPTAKLLGSFLVLALVAGACGNDDGDDGAAPDDTPAETSAAVVTFDPELGELPEGVAVDDEGNVYASLSPLGRLVRVASGTNTAETVGTVEGLNEGDFGLIGITVRGADVAYGGVFSTNVEVHGVWRFDLSDGTTTRIPGSEAIAFPNDVAVDGDTLYISDSIGPDGDGAIWRSVADGEVEVWAQDPLLAGDGSLEFGFPIGANGLDAHDSSLYVGITEAAAVVTIPIEDDGSAGAASTFADLSTAGPGGGPVLVDGVAVADDGEVYIAAPALTLVMRVGVDGSTENVASEDDGLDVPTSVATADGAIYVASFSVALEAFSNMMGPSITRVPL